MHIARFSGIHIRRDNSTTGIDDRYELGDTHVYTASIGTENEGKNYRAIAIRKFHPNASNLIQKAHEERKKCESSIEHIANILGIRSCSEHLILSEFPVIAFRPDVQSEEAYIDCLLKEFKYRGSSRMEISRLNLNNLKTVIELVSDRTNGVAALSAALNCSTKLAQYRELVRFFEIAFKISFVMVDKKLYQYLAPTELGFKRNEIQEWRGFRHPSIHGDGIISQEIIFELDVAHLLERMKIAAFDVLFNKTKWGSKDIERRIGYEIPGFSKDGSKLIGHNDPVQVRAVFMDQFKVWGIKSGTIDTNEFQAGGWRFSSTDE